MTIGIPQPIYRQDAYINQLTHGGWFTDIAIFQKNLKQFGDLQQRFHYIKLIKWQTANFHQY